MKSGVQKIFGGIIIGLLVGLLFLVESFRLVEGFIQFWFYIFYIILLVISVLIYTKGLPFNRVINTTDNNWDDINHLRWVYNRLKHIHKENERYDYMIRLKDIIDTMEMGKKKNNH